MSTHRPLPLWVLASPLVFVLVGHTVARLAAPGLGGWAWVPTNLALWLLFAGISVHALRLEGVKASLGPARGPVAWRVGAVVVGLLPLPVFLAAFHHLADPLLLLCWIGFAAVNPLLEELYWRATLLQAAEGRMRRGLAVPAIALLFALNHPLSLGVFSVANAHPATAISTFVLGLVWSGAYLRTGTLRHAVAGHVLTDLLNASVIVFLNLYVPRVPG